ncbi:general stress protein [Metabacillus sp. 84]|uniref:general stress protein n=1 Tax=unclassified Metabacillus TaxID=2675274 RepID=UPI003CF92ECB
MRGIRETLFQEAIITSPKLKLFHIDEHLKEAIDLIRNDGVRDEDIYILSHGNDLVRRSRKETDANIAGVHVTDLGTVRKYIPQQR